MVYSSDAFTLTVDVALEAWQQAEGLDLTDRLLSRAEMCVSPLLCGASTIHSLNRGPWCFLPSPRLPTPTTVSVFLLSFFFVPLLLLPFLHISQVSHKRGLRLEPLPATKIAF